MHWLRHALSLAMLTLMLYAPRAAEACPLCKEAISSPSSGDEEINNAPLAYNHSIYLMAGMPYVLLSFFGFMIYRGCKKNEEHRQGNPHAPREDRAQPSEAVNQSPTY